MSPPVGATGIQTCNDPGSGSDSAASFRRFRVGAAYGAFSSTLKLGGRDVDISQRAVTTTLDVRTTDRLTLQAGLGAVLSGSLGVEGRSFDVKPGWLFSVGAGYRFVDGEGAAPFVLGSVSYAMSFSHTQESAIANAPRPSLTTADVRLGLAVGKTFFEVLSPYVVARVFGGPVVWSLGDEKLTGGDKYHYQVGAGLSVVIARRIDAFVEGVPLGEKRFSFGAGFSF
jgi:hypothetical protein